jgi:hypothetical protein
MRTFKTIWLGAWLSLAFAASLYGFRGDRESPRTIGLTPVSAKAPASVAIESIRVGDRVMSALSGGELGGETAVDPLRWRKLGLYAEILWDDGSVDDVHVETLQPPQWVQEHAAVTGARVPLPLDLTEMGLPETLVAEVRSVEPCPAIAVGPGRVVLTTVNHLNRSVCELTVESSRGNVEKVRPTAAHKFYRASDEQWVAAIDLEVGDTLQGVDDTLTIREVKRYPGVHRVYNMTVEGEHVYRVGSLGTLVHNTCYDDVGDLRITDKAGAGAARPPRHHVFPRENRQWFSDRGFDIDKVTVPLDQGTHSALHTMGWSKRLMGELTRQEALLGRQLTPREIWDIGYRQMRIAEINQLPILPYIDETYECVMLGQETGGHVSLTVPGDEDTLMCSRHLEQIPAFLSGRSFECYAKPKTITIYQSRTYKCRRCILKKPNKKAYYERPSQIHLCGDFGSI